MNTVEKNVIEQESIQERNLALFLQNFPGIVSTGEDGELVINTDKLKLALDPKARFEENGYELNWVGKKEAYHQAYVKQAKILQPLAEDSKLNDRGDFLADSTGNILIKGDNLEALKLLKASYFEQVKMIYIDPPYNTKSENFIYRDNFTATEDAILDELGYSPEYKDYIQNIQGARTHSGWLSFMFPRLLLARDLLKEDGVIFISIDENEQANLKLLCDEVFGEQNFVECITWNKRVPKNDKGIGNIHEYIFLYAKDTAFKHKFLMRKEGLDDVYELVEKLKKDELPIAQAEKELKKLYKKNGYDRGITLYNSLDIDYRIWGKINMSWPNQDTFGPRYEILHPVTRKPVSIPDRGWRWTETTFNKAAGLKNGVYENIETLHDGSSRCGNIWFAKDENTQPSSIKYLDDVNDMLLRSILSTKSDGGVELEKLFEQKSLFSRPKSSSLLKALLGSLQSSGTEVILDFFAGSGTTGQAVMELNAEDGGNRKFILVQLPEAIDPKKQKDAYEFVTKTLGKKEATIFEITAERLRRAGEKVKKDHADKQAIQTLDIGFKAFAIADDPMQQFYKPLHQVTPEDLAQLEIALSSETLEASLPTILINLLLAEKLPLSTPIIPLVENALYQAANVLLILNDLPISDIKTQLSQTQNRVEYVSIYSPNISGPKRDQFSQELKPALLQMGLDESRLRFRG
ncbi:site-specific DNA-methyltransferase [Thiomicrospira microaerophila]|uniref:site-specific DNA-methyltransferase n=1 Tax=Thiomicrospira microaerophila TaxID=406020 RepID=UPI0005CAAA2F|nr:site-specific DNA-methyltransferase [Thiomicrospira microaerophila]